MISERYPSLHIDVFNGDADGICALHQLRLHNPQESLLITGVKRDTRLLKKVISAEEKKITVLDISAHANSKELNQLLNQQNSIQYFDHHFAGDLPDSPHFHSFINTQPDVCTSILVDQYLDGKHQKWAIVAAFGDNLHKPALELCKKWNLSELQKTQLKELGELINYNSYGETLDDLHFSPESLYRNLHAFTDPFSFFHESREVVHLREGFASDMKQGENVPPERETETGRIFHFPNAAWGRRTAGVFSNKIAREKPEKAHALLVERHDGSFLVGIRSPLENPVGADQLCMRFSGGGRSAAGGINQLPESAVEEFYRQFELQFKRI